MSSHLFASLSSIVADLLARCSAYLSRSGTKHVRITGACKQTGNCCRNLILLNGKRPVRNMRDFERLKRRYPEYEMFSRRAEQSSDEMLRFTCSNLTEQHTCGIYESRPLMCRRYPSAAMVQAGGDLLPGCGYKIEPVESFDHLLGDSLVRIGKDSKKD